VIDFPPPATPVVLVVTDWAPLTGFDEVTVGMVGPAVVHVAPGGIEPTGAPGMAPTTTTPPKIGSFASFQHPAARATNTNVMDHIARLVTPSNLFFICFPSSSDLEKRRCNRPTPHWYCAPRHSLSTCFATEPGPPIENRAGRNEGVTPLVLIPLLPATLCSLPNARHFFFGDGLAVGGGLDMTLRSASPIGNPKRPIVLYTGTSSAGAKRRQAS